MSAPEGSTSESVLAVCRLLERHQAGDDTARAELIEASLRRLRILVKQIFNNIPRLRAVEQTDDLLQNSLVRLWKCLATTTPETPVDYFRLAACLIRRELIDLSRQHYNNGRKAIQQFPENRAAADLLDGQAFCAPGEDSFNPASLDQWTDFHNYVEGLPEEERDLFDLLWYQGLSMDDSSALLGIPLRTLGRRWKLSRLRLFRELLSE